MKVALPSLYSQRQSTNSISGRDPSASEPTASVSPP
eukprot:CAMPEP_0197450432 /NCGR_PEP_ID=MMETSP1175-20131217/25367_1 /TAXON_ID=1003142 /ORGANISM="Triceratium dubium, Strain CCMP147" /LENGTH=35 /DNA_ID= /DNA_START= /DNA_END= /DNA_ORIENTATION=